MSEKKVYGAGFGLCWLLDLTGRDSRRSKNRFRLKWAWDGHGIHGCFGETRGQAVVVDNETDGDSRRGC